jgi:CheY-like chemotaxis protein
MTLPARATVLALTSDLYLIPRLEDAARSLGLALEVGELPGAPEPAGGRTGPEIALTEPLEGPAAGLVRRVAQDPPALILVDLSSDPQHAAESIRTLKTSSATRRVPIVAFGPHVDGEALAQARAAGAERVVTRGQLHSSLGEILRGEARPVDSASIAEGCAGDLSAAARSGLEALRAGRYFEAHEHLERAILADPGPEATVYRALLHLAVAHLHTERGNWRGAQKMLLRMRAWTATLPARCRGVDVAALRAALESLQAQLDRWKTSGEAPVVPVPPPLAGVD